ncbi:Hypothetical predicted protein [Marmota monax]|uniref:Uncharacterized protein n=1 Tax=Marmota monax TaxID=9995 RepID=A0A5E4D6V6_MARMO|nr:Hypothetical predicted protein [Marmota monax]
MRYENEKRSQFRPVHVTRQFIRMEYSVLCREWIYSISAVHPPFFCNTYFHLLYHLSTSCLSVSSVCPPSAYHLPSSAVYLSPIDNGFSLYFYTEKKEDSLEEEMAGSPRVSAVTSLDRAGVLIGTHCVSPACEPAALLDTAHRAPRPAEGHAVLQSTFVQEVPRGGSESWPRSLPVPSVQGPQCRSRRPHSPLQAKSSCLPSMARVGHRRPSNLQSQHI